MPKVGSVRTHDRFNRITWGYCNGPGEGGGQLQDMYPEGLIAGGLVDGTVQLWDAAAIMDSEYVCPSRRMCPSTCSISVEAPGLG